MPKFLDEKPWNHLLSDSSYKIKIDQTIIFSIRYAEEIFFNEIVGKDGIVFDEGFTVEELKQRFNQIIHLLIETNSEEILSDELIKLENSIKGYRLSESMKREYCDLNRLFREYLFYYNKADEIIPKRREFKDAICEEIYKLHVNLPLLTNRISSISFFKQLKVLLGNAVDSNLINSVKFLDGLLKNRIMPELLPERFRNAAQIAIYLKSGTDNFELTSLIKEINALAKSNGIEYVLPSFTDSKLTDHGVVSFRLDYDSDGNYIAADDVTKEHLEQQENLKILKELREELAVPALIEKPSRGCALS